MDKSKKESFLSAFPDNIEAVRYDLEHEDVMLSARLVDAAARGRWTQVRRLQADGADPRICRYIANGRCVSALYFALKAEKYDIAYELLQAGDRLDDLRVGEYDALSGAAVNFLVRAQANGINPFAEKEKPLSECIRCGLWAQAREAMKSATRKELNLSVEMIFLYLQPENAVRYLQFLDELKARGANLELIVPFREEIEPVLLRFSPMVRAEFMERIGEYITEDSIDGQRT